MNFFKKSVLFFAVASFAFCAYAADSKLPNVVLSGSDLIKPLIEPTLLDLAKKNGVKFDINMNGTYAVLKDLATKDFDVAVVAVPKGQKIPDGLIALPFAYQAAMVVVNISNPIDEISTDSLRRIYSRVNSNRFETWEQLGIRHAGLRNVLPVVTGYSDGVIVELFKYSCFDGDELGDWVNIRKNSDEVSSNIRVNNAAIGVVGRVYDKNMLKVLSVSDSKGAGAYRYAFTPNQETLFNGDYPMSLNFYVVFQKKNSKKVKQVVNILMSDAIAKQLDKSGMFSAPKNSRKKSLFELDIL